MRCSARTNARRVPARLGSAMMRRAVMSAAPVETLEEIDDESRDLGSGILLQEMATGDEMRPLRMRQELLPALAERRIVEDVVLTAPNDRGRHAAVLQLLLEPDEAVEGARGLIERNP